MNLIAIIFVIFFQATTDFSFTDSCDNKIIFEDVQRFPKSIDSTFLSKNLSSKLLNQEYCEKPYKFEIRIIEIKKLSKNRYDLRVYAIPKGDSITMKEKFRYMGYSHYEMKTAKVDNKLVIRHIKWSYGEV